MERLPWFVKREIIDYILLEKKEYCLVCKEWFTYGASQCIKLDGNILSYKKQPSKWFKYAEKLSLDSFSELNWGFLKGCHKIKEIDFKLGRRPTNIPGEFLTLCKTLSIVVFNLTFSSGSSLEKHYCMLEDILNKTKVLNLEIESKLIILEDFFNTSFLNITKFNMNFYSEISFYLLYCSMPSLVFLTVNIENISFVISSNDTPIFPSLKELYIIYHRSYHSEENIVSGGLFKFYFPVLQTFHLNNSLDKIELTGISKAMPKLKQLHLELASHRVLSSFPNMSLMNIEELNLNFINRVQDKLRLNLYNLPKLRQLQINEDFEISDLMIEYSSMIINLECLWVKEFPFNSVYNQLLNLTKLNINCTYLGSVIFIILQLCDRVKELTLVDLNDKVSSDNLPAGPFKTAYLKMTGYKFSNNDLLNWFGLQCRLTQLILSYRKFEALDIVCTKFSKLDYFKIIQPSGDSYDSEIYYDDSDDDYFYYDSSDY